MPFHNKTSDLSVRSKRRRVAEDLKNSTLLPMEIQNQIGNFTSASTLNSENTNNVTYSLSPSLIKQNSTQISLNTNIHQHTNSVNDIGLDTYLSDLLISSDESDSLENELIVNTNINFDHVSNFKNLIKIWAIECNVPQNTLNGLLTVLKKHSCFINLPKDSRTLMHNTRMDIENLHTVEPGTYYHFGIENGIKLNLLPDSGHQNAIKIVVGIDGLPLFKSSSDTFWPILAYICPYSKVFLIGIYHGKKSPSDNVPARTVKIMSNSSKRQLYFDISNELIDFKANTSPYINSSKKQALEHSSVTDSRRISKHQNDLSQNMIMTSSSPFKVTSELTNNEENTSSISSIVNAINTSKKEASEYSSMIDMLTNINRTSLNIWYEMRTFNQRFDTILEILNNSYNRTPENTIVNSGDFITNLPIKSEIELLDFEQKLLDSVFKVKVVSELSRLARTTIQSTIRAIVRYLFKDDLLQYYSYKGQKKKHVFSTLSSCSIVFDAIKIIPKFKHFNTIDVENAIKIFIAGAKFRLLQNTRHQTTDIADVINMPFNE